MKGDNNGNRLTNTEQAKMSEPGFKFSLDTMYYDRETGSMRPVTDPKTQQTARQQNERIAGELTGASANQQGGNRDAGNRGRAGN